MRTYTVGEAAALAGCSKATMARLKQKGVLEGGRGFVKAPNRQVLAQTVEEATRGRHGWKWRPRKGRSYNARMDRQMEAILRDTGILPQEIYQGPAPRELPELGMPDKSPVAALKLWTAFSWERRSLLLRLAERYTDEELRLLAEL